jgi:hypothetical protein
MDAVKFCIFKQEQPRRDIGYSKSFCKRRELIYMENVDIHNINTRNKHHLHRPNANLSCFQKSAYCAGIRIFNRLPLCLSVLMNDKVKFKKAVQKYLNTHSFYSVDEFLMCTENNTVV